MSTSQPKQNDGPSKPDWRHGFGDHLEASETQWRKERASGSLRTVEIPGKRAPRSVCSLSDSQIRDLARREASADMERAINEWNCNEANSRRKFRSGQAA